MAPRSAWSAEQVQQCLSAVAVDDLASVQAAVPLGTSGERLEALLASGLEGVGESDRATLATAIGGFEASRRDRKGSGSGNGGGGGSRLGGGGSSAASPEEGRVKIAVEPVEGLVTPRFGRDDQVVLQLLFAMAGRVELRMRASGRCVSAAGGAYGGEWWLLQADRWALSGVSMAPALVRLGTKEAMLAEAERIRALAPSLGDHAPALDAVVWHGARGGLRLMPRGSVWAGPVECREAMSTPLLPTMRRLIQGRVRMATSGRMGRCAGGEEDSSESGSDSGSSGDEDGGVARRTQRAAHAAANANARTASAAFRGSGGIGAALTELVDGAIAPMVQRTRVRASVNLFAHYDVAELASAALARLQPKAPHGAPYAPDAVAALDDALKRHHAPVYADVAGAGGAVPFLKRFLAQLRRSKVLNEKEVASAEVARAFKTGGAQKRVRMLARAAPVRWVASAHGALCADSVLCDVHEDHPALRGMENPKALGNACLLKDGGAVGGGLGIGSSPDLGRGLRHMWLTGMGAVLPGASLGAAAESAANPAHAVRRHALWDVARLEVDLCGCLVESFRGDFEEPTAATAAATAGAKASAASGGGTGTGTKAAAGAAAQRAGGESKANEGEEGSDDLVSEEAPADPNLPHALSVLADISRVHTLGASLPSARAREVSALEDGLVGKGGTPVRFHMLWMSLRELRRSASTMVGADKDMVQYEIALLAHALGAVAGRPAGRLDAAGDAAAAEGTSAQSYALQQDSGAMSPTWALAIAVTQAARLMHSVLKDGFVPDGGGPITPGGRPRSVAPAPEEEKQSDSAQPPPLRAAVQLHESVKYLRRVAAAGGLSSLTGRAAQAMAETPGFGVATGSAGSRKKRPGRRSSAVQMAEGGGGGDRDGVQALLHAPSGPMPAGTLYDPMLQLTLSGCALLPVSLGAGAGGAEVDDSLIGNGANRRDTTGAGKADAAKDGTSGKAFDVDVLRVAADSAKDALMHGDGEVSLSFGEGLGPARAPLMALLPGATLRPTQALAVVSGMGGGKTTALHRIATVMAAAQLSWHARKAKLLDMAHQHQAAARRKAKLRDGGVRSRGGYNANGAAGAPVGGRGKLSSDAVTQEQWGTLIAEHAAGGFGSGMILPLHISLPQLASLAYAEYVNPLDDDGVRLISLWIRATYGDLGTPPSEAHVAAVAAASKGRGNLATESDHRVIVTAAHAAVESTLSPQGRMLLAALHSRRLLLLLDSGPELTVLRDEMLEWAALRLPEEGHALVVVACAPHISSRAPQVRHLLSRCAVMHPLPAARSRQLTAMQARADAMAQAGLHWGSAGDDALMSAATPQEASRQREQLMRVLPFSATPFALGAVVGCGLRLSAKDVAYSRVMTHILTRERASLTGLVPAMPENAAAAPVEAPVEAEAEAGAEVEAKVEAKAEAKAEAPGREVDGEKGEQGGDGAAEAADGGAAAGAIKPKRSSMAKGDGQAPEAAKKHTPLMPMPLAVVSQMVAGQHALALASARRIASSPLVTAGLPLLMQLSDDAEEMRPLLAFHRIKPLLARLAHATHRRRVRTLTVAHMERVATEDEISSGLVEALAKWSTAGQLPLLSVLPAQEGALEAHSLRLGTRRRAMEQGSTTSAALHSHLPGGGLDGDEPTFRLGSHLCMQQFLVAQFIVGRLELAEKRANGELDGADDVHDGGPAIRKRGGVHFEGDTIEAGDDGDSDDATEPTVKHMGTVQVVPRDMRVEIFALFGVGGHSGDGQAVIDVANAEDADAAAASPVALLHDIWWQPVVLMCAELLSGMAWKQLIAVVSAADPKALSGLLSLAIFEADLHAVRALVEGGVAVPPQFCQPASEGGMLPLHTACCAPQGGTADSMLVTVLLEVFPGACKVVDEREGRLPLHYACDTPHPAPKVVYALLNAYPGAASVKDERGCFAFHYLCRAAGGGSVSGGLARRTSLLGGAGADADDDGTVALLRTILQCHLAAASEGDHDGRTGLHYACMSAAPSALLLRTLLEVAPEAAGQKDHASRRLPLHCACARSGGMPSGAFERLLSAYPSATSIEDRWDDMPIDVMLIQSAVAVPLLEALVKHMLAHVGVQPGDEAEDEPGATAAAAAVAAAAGMLSDDIVMRAIKYLFSHPMPNVAVTTVLLSAASYNVRAAAKQLLDNVPREREGIDDELVVVPVETAVEIFLLMPEGSISVRDKWGQHPLHWAVSVRHDNVGADGADGAKGSGGGDDGGDAAAARRAREELRQRSTGATVKALLKIDPGGARIADSHGRLPLHWACESAVPSEVAIELLVETFPEGVLAQDQAGLLPLHYISANLAAEAAMVAVVLEAAPETAGVPALHGMLALHFACRAENSLEEWADAVDLLLEYHPEGAELADERFGMLPLHWACHTHVPNEAVVLALLATYPGAAGRADVRWGNLPLHWLCSSRAPMLTLVDALLEAYPDGAKEVDTRAGRLPLHFACENPHAAPEVVRVLLEAHPDSVREADELVGRLPLHWICRNKTAPPALALEIVHMYKQGVSVLDETGMLPLHIACDAKRANDRVVKALVDEYPDGVYKRDKQVRAR
jgi:ankyrin repeat protein